MMRQPAMLLFSSLSLLFGIGAALPAVAPPEKIPLTQSSWKKYEVETWLPKFMEQHGVLATDFLTAFPKAVKHPMDCGLDISCTNVPNLAPNASKEDIQINLVLAGLTHFNDIFRMIDRLWNSDFDDSVDEGFSFRDGLIQTFANIYSGYSVENLNTTVSAELPRLLLIPAWFIPDAIPNSALTSTLNNVIKATAKPKWAWKDYAVRPSGQQYNNIAQTVQDLSEAWGDQYRGIVAGDYPITTLDFLKGGDLLNVKYAEELASTGWHKQANQMFLRQTLSLVLEANGVIIHRGNYDNLEPNDAAMELNYFFDDPYSHSIYAPIHYGVDSDGNVTRQYTPRFTFLGGAGVPSRVIYGQSWQCFKETNNNEFSSNYRRAWDFSAYNKSLFIYDWDGTSDGFDAHNPSCTFNIPVNNQPSDIKDSWFLQRLIASCSSFGFATSYFAAPDYNTYRQVMLASDAWAYSTVSSRSASMSTAMTSACNAADKYKSEFGKKFVTSVKDAFILNLELGAVFHLGNAFKSLKTAGQAGARYVKGGWNKVFKEKPPVIAERPSMPPSELLEQHSPSNPQVANQPANKPLGDGDATGSRKQSAEESPKSRQNEGDKDNAANKGEDRTSADNHPIKDDSPNRGGKDRSATSDKNSEAKADADIMAEIMRKGRESAGKIEGLDHRR